jgi:transposase
MSRTDLTEKQWRKLEPRLPSNPRHGHVYVEHRHVINGILWRLRTGALWRDIPSRYGPGRPAMTVRPLVEERNVAASAQGSARCSRRGWRGRLGWRCARRHAHQGPA